VLKKLIDEYAPVARAKGIQFASHLPPGPQMVPLHELTFGSAIANILDNAIKFTAESGNVSLQAEQNENNFVITVTDTGVGIAAEELPKLFTKFHRGTDLMQYDYEGTGIGLYATKLIIDQHGGSIDVASTFGKGTTVTIAMPTS
jgi:signal transduction histidine kinase